MSIAQAARIAQVVDRIRKVSNDTRIPLEMIVEGTHGYYTIDSIAGDMGTCLSDREHQSVVASLTMNS